MEWYPDIWQCFNKTGSKCRSKNKLRAQLLSTALISRCSSLAVRKTGDGCLCLRHFYQAVMLKSYLFKSVRRALTVQANIIIP